jgi:multicomponent Na+:H+ antiporter subunit E
MHLFLGVISCLFVSFTSHNLLIGDANIRDAFGKIIRFFKYLPWLLYQIWLANLDVVYRTLHPDMPIAPKIIKFKTNFKTDLAKVILANSITLTPGTVTIDIKGDEFIVHAIAEAPAESLLSGEMQARVKQIEG